MVSRGRSEDYGQLQEFIDALYEADQEALIPRIEIVMQAESYDLNTDLLELVGLLPPGNYARVRLCTQLNSSLSSHGWSQVYGTVR